MKVPAARHTFHGLDSGRGDKNLVDAISHAIIEYFARGITASNDSIFFAYSTLGITDEDDIARILTDADCYGEGLCDLIFTPAQSLRVDLELMIPSEGLSDKACADIEALVLDSLKSTRINFQTTGRSLAVNIPVPILSRFIRRLNLNKRVIFPLAVETPYGANREFLARVRVVVRNARYTTSPAREKFLLEMMERMMSDNRIAEETILDCIVFMLNLFGEYPVEVDLYPLISETKRSFQALLSGMDRYRDFAGRYSMEYLMSKRIQRPAVDYDDAMKKIYLSDVICMSVYGKVADSGMPR